MEQPTKLELLVNLRTAKALGIELPPTVFRPRRRGDRVSVCFRANQIVEATLPNDQSLTRTGPRLGGELRNSAHTQVPTMLDELHSVCILAHSRERSGYGGTNPHLPICPTFQIGDREALEERVCLDELLSFGPAGCIRTCHNRGSVGVLQC